MKRRSFLKSVAAGTCGVLASPVVLPSSALGRDAAVAPSERITMGLIGCGSHGAGWNLDRMFQNPVQQVVAVCDVDANRMKSTQKRVEDWYSSKSERPYGGCGAYGDFRELVNRKDIDAVCIVTPDHWHVPISVFAMKAGKDVICEKPTLTIKEGRLLCETQKKTQRVFQTASENRSIDCYQQLVNLARNGHLGDVRNIKVLLPPGNVSSRNAMQEDADRTDTEREAPAWLNYEMWLGQAPYKPYVPARLHYNWRWNYDYSGGVYTDWGSHLVNVAQWALDADGTGPVSVKAEGELPPFDAVWNTPPKIHASYRYANGVTLDVQTEVPAIKIEGTKGWVLCRGWRQPLRASDEKLLEIKFEGTENLGRPASTVPAKGGNGGEHVDFAECVKSRKSCYYTAESGHRTHTISHIANISMLLGGAELQWNPATETFEGNRAEEANKHFCYQRPQREPWSYEKIDSWINVG